MTELERSGHADRDRMATQNEMREQLGQLWFANYENLYGPGYVTEPGSEH